MLLTVFTGAIRFVLRDVLLHFQSVRNQQQLRVAIYGAGEAGAQLAAALRLAGNHRIVTFLDDNHDYWNRTVNGVIIQSPKILKQLDNYVDQVLLAIPSLPRSERRRIVDELQGLGLTVLQVPSVDDLMSGRARIDTLQQISIEDLLGRDQVPTDPKLLGPGIQGAVVCVTGAGGSIGSNLCRQILELSPAKLILLEQSEPALYAIEQELHSLLPEHVELLSVLGSASDIMLLNRLFTFRSVDIVFHAAAYKHVPLVRPTPWRVWPTTLDLQINCRTAMSAQVRQVVPFPVIKQCAQQA